MDLRPHVIRAGGVIRTIMHAAYHASVELGREKGAFLLFDAEGYLAGNFASRLPFDLRTAIAAHGLRNSHLMAIALLARSACLAGMFRAGSNLCSTATSAPRYELHPMTWNGPISVRLFGSHKTFVGFTVGIIAGLIAAYVQVRFAPAVFLRWHNDEWLAVGLACGVGAMGGDLVKSFFKRRQGIAPGKSWVPFDQLDFAAGALLLLAFFVPLSISDVALILVFTFAADIAVNQISFRAGIRDTPW